MDSGVEGNARVPTDKPGETSVTSDITTNARNVQPTVFSVPRDGRIGVVTD